MEPREALELLERFSAIVDAWTLRQEHPTVSSAAVNEMARELGPQAAIRKVPVKPFTDVEVSWYRCNDPDCRRAISHLRAQLRGELLLAASTRAAAVEAPIDDRKVPLTEEQAVAMIHCDTRKAGLSVDEWAKIIGVDRPTLYKSKKYSKFRDVVRGLTDGRSFKTKPKVTDSDD